jgi:serine O-acetyltransferase
MIINKSDLIHYLQEDALLYPKQSGSLVKKLINCMVTNPINTQYYIYKYLRILRYAEFHTNNSALNKGKKDISSVYHTIIMIFFYWRLRRISYKTGLQIPPNTCGYGLQIYHYGYLIINPCVKIGVRAILYPGVEIGEKNGGVPIIGDDVFVGAGAKILGGINVGNNVTIAPNAVVVKDVPDNAIVGGIPAKIIRVKNESTSNKYSL